MLHLRGQSGLQVVTQATALNGGLSQRLDCPLSPQVRAKLGDVTRFAQVEPLGDFIDIIALNTKGTVQHSEVKPAVMAVVA